jgi:hypothetical protein
MKRLALIFIILLLFPSFGQSAILFYDNCETDRTEVLWEKRLSPIGGKTITISSEQKLAGNNSYKFYYPAGSTKHAVITVKNEPARSAVINQDKWYGYALYLPADWQNPTSWMSIENHHDVTHDAAGNTWVPRLDACDYCDDIALPWKPVSFWIVGTTAAPTFNLKIAGSPEYCMAYPQDATCSFHSYRNTSINGAVLNKGAWNRIVMHLRLNYNDGDALTEVWINSAKISTTNRNCFNDVNDSAYFWIGIYAGSTASHTQFYDEIRIGDSNSSYAEVDPGGTVPHIPPTVTITSPAGTQAITQGDSLNFTCTRTLGDGTSWQSVVWNFDTSGIANATVEDPGSRQFNIVGDFTVTVTVTDNNGLIGSDTVPITVGAPPAGPDPVNRYELESGAIITDAEGNENLVNNGTIVNEGTGTESDPPGYGTHGVVLNGSSQYFSVANYDAQNPWQVGEPDGTILCALKPDTFTTNRIIASRWGSTAASKVIALMIYSNGAPGLMIGDGDSVEYLWMSQPMTIGHRYLVGWQVSQSDKSYRVIARDVETGSWLTLLAGTYTDNMYLAGTTAWNIGRATSGYYFDGTLYWLRTYNEELTSAEMEEILTANTPEPATLVTVNTAGGTPYILLETGSTDLQVAYASGSGTGQLTFSGTAHRNELITVTTSGSTIVAMRNLTYGT